MTRPTPCQQCKADLERARARVAELERTVAIDVGTIQLLKARVAELDAKCAENAESYDALVESEHAASERGNRLARRASDLKAGLNEAIDRLNAFLQAYEGAPDPSENDTKHLVVRLIDLLQTPETP